MCPLVDLNLAFYRLNPIAGDSDRTQSIVAIKSLDH